MNSINCLLLLLFVISPLKCFADSPQASDIYPHEMKCEYLRNPIGIESQQPRLSWFLKARDENKRSLKQVAYQILVSSSSQIIANNTGDIWDSGKVESSKLSQIIYEGPQLTSRHRYWWKVRIWDQNSVASKYSYSSHWEMGLLNETDWNAIWIGAPKEIQESAKENISDIDRKVVY
jgi:alpha-L-rhamnosidase